MEIELTSEDCTLLERILSHALKELRVEVRRTTTPQYHDEMAKDEARLRDLLERIRALA